MLCDILLRDYIAMQTVFRRYRAKKYRIATLDHLLFRTTLSIYGQIISNIGVSQRFMNLN